MLALVYEDDVFMMYETMNSILGELKNLDNKKCKLAIEDSSLVQEALKDAIEQDDLALKLKTTNLILEIWYLFPTIVSQSGEKKGIGALSQKDSFHLVLQKGLQQHDKVFQLNIFAIGFTLLDRLAQKDNSETSAVYKTLTGGLIEHYRGKQNDKQIDYVSTQLILQGFKTVFEDHDDVLAKVLLEPFVN